jgi:hypothetical protein
VLQDAHELAETVVATALEIGDAHGRAGDQEPARAAYEMGLQMAERTGSAELSETARKALVSGHDMAGPR